MGAPAGKQGMALVVVLCLSALALGALAILASIMSGAALRSRDMLRNEQAFFVAEGAVEVAVQHIANGGAVPITLTGSMGAGRYSVNIVAGGAVNGYPSYHVYSTGTVGRMVRRVNIRGVRQSSWAKYALWYNAEALQLWIVGGESFNGPVHANTNFWFHSHNVSSLGQAHFYDGVSTTASNYVRYDETVHPVFDHEVVFNAPTQSTQSVDFGQLRSNASLVVTGVTYITLGGTNMVISNRRMGWTNRAVAIPSNGSVYVANVTTGTVWTRTNNVYVGGPSGMSGRLTIISESDIQITNHLRYVDNPETNSASQDALGLVAKTNIVVYPSAPSNLEVFAHLIAAVGGFGVTRYADSALGNRGVLKVYGGIVNQTRQPVGTTGGTGYRKNYIYDPRFRTVSPPGYPVLPSTYEWYRWEQE